MFKGMNLFNTVNALSFT